MSGWRATVGFPFLALASPIFLPLPPSPKLQWQEAVSLGQQPLSPFPSLPRAGREPAEDLVGSTGSCLFSRSIVPDAPSLR